MRVVVFRHVPFEGLGTFAPVLAERGISIEFVDLYRTDAVLPDAAGAAGLIFMGGPMSVNDGLPYLASEMEIIREAIEQGQPVLGVCLGAQLVAKALGAAVYRNAVKEIGWFEINLTGAACDDLVFTGLRPTETVFQWHGDTFDLPNGATWLATSDACRHQAFRVGRNVYAFQFHLEVTPDMIADWCAQDANCGDVREMDAPIDPRLHSLYLEQLSRRVFGRWCSLLR